MAKSAISVSAITVFTLIFSFIKEAIFANYYGASYITDAYSIAIQIPVTLFSMVSMAISNVALPYYSKKLNIDGEDASTQYISNLMTIVTILSLLIVGVLEIYPQIAIKVFAPGLGEEASKLANTLFRMVLPTIILTELININTAVQDVHRSFVLPQLGSILLNLTFVSAVIFFSGKYGIFAALLGTIIGTIFEFCYSIALRRRFVKYKLICNVADSDVKATIKKCGPVFIGLGVAEINKTIDTMISSFLEAGSVSMLGYASKLTSAISTLLIGGIVRVTYPEFAECAAKGDDTRMADCLLFSIKIVVLLLFPVVFGGAVLGKELISIVYFRGAFKLETVLGTAPIFVAYLTCLIFRALRQNFSRVFYSYGDTKTPMFNGFIGLAVNTILDLSLYKRFGATGIAWATTGTYVAVSLSLALKVRRRNQHISYRKVLPVIIRTIAACACMSVVLVLLRTYFVNIGLYDIGNVFKNAVFLGISIITGAVVYFIVLLLLKTEEPVIVFKKITRR